DAVVELDAGVGELPGEGQDDADLDGALCQRRPGSQQGARNHSPSHDGSLHCFLLAAYFVPTVSAATREFNLGCVPRIRGRPGYWSACATMPTTIRERKAMIDSSRRTVLTTGAAAAATAA